MEKNRTARFKGWLKREDFVFQSDDHKKYNFPQKKKKKKSFFILPCIV